MILPRESGAIFINVGIADTLAAGLREAIGAQAALALPLSIANGGTGASTAADARAALEFGKTILSDIALSVGGTITNAAVSKLMSYSVIGVEISGAGMALCSRSGSAIRGLYSFFFNDTIYTDLVQLYVSGQSVTFSLGKRMTHIGGGMHGTIINLGATITTIVGMA